jgi:hypothetical protein
LVVDDHDPWKAAVGRLWKTVPWLTLLTTAVLRTSARKWSLPVFKL